MALDNVNVVFLGAATSDDCFIFLLRSLGLLWYERWHPAHGVRKGKGGQINNDPLLVQCYRCQQFGFTSMRCRSNPVCGKCAGRHRTMDCVERVYPPRCANCGSTHIASYKGCPVFEKLKSLSERDTAAARSLSSPPAAVSAARNFKESTAAAAPEPKIRYGISPATRALIAECGPNQGPNQLRPAYHRQQQQLPRRQIACRLWWPLIWIF